MSTSVKRLYVSGPMTGYPDLNRGNFAEATELLEGHGYEVFSPAEVVLATKTEPAWEDFVRYELRALLDCQGVALIGNWQASRGACLEVHVAKELRLPVLPVYAWLQKAPSCTCDGPYDAHPGFGHHPNCDLSTGVQP